MLYILGDNSIQPIMDVKGKSLRTLITLNKMPLAGKVSTSAHTFSDQNWGAVTRKLMAAAAQCTDV